MKRFFGLGDKQSKGLDLQIMDARDFIRNYRGEKFDLIIEDLYFEQNGVAERAVVMDEVWMKALRRHLDPQGMLVCNFPDQHQFRAATHLELPWRSMFAFTLPAYENCIGVFTQRRDLLTDIPAALRKCAARDKRIPAKVPSFRWRRMR